MKNFNFLGDLITYVGKQLQTRKTCIVRYMYGNVLLVCTARSEVDYHIACYTGCGDSTGALVDSIERLLKARETEIND